MEKKTFGFYVDIKMLALIILQVIILLDDTKQWSKSQCFSVSLIRNLLKLIAALNQAL